MFPETDPNLLKPTPANQHHIINISNMNIIVLHFFRSLKVWIFTLLPTRNEQKSPKWLVLRKTIPSFWNFLFHKNCWYIKYVTCTLCSFIQNLTSSLPFSVYFSFTSAFQSLLSFYLLLVIGRLHMTSHISRQKNWLTKSSNLCWKGIRGVSEK